MAGIMDFLSRPELYQWLGGVGGGLSRASRGRGFDISDANQQFYGQMNDRRTKEQLAGMMGQFTPEQQQLLGTFDTQTLQKALYDQQFPQHRTISDMERAWGLLPLEDQKLAARIVAGIVPKAGGGDEYGVTPVYGRDANGNLVIMQTSKAGGVKQVDLPAGVQPLPTYNQQLIDTGTAVIPYDTRGGGAGAPIPKDVAGAAAQSASGGAFGKAEAEKTLAAPSAIAGAKRVKGIIAGLRNDPYLPRMLGYSSYLPSVSPDSARVKSKINQLSGANFLEAYKTLKGGGQITEVEGKKAEQASARLAEAQTVEDFNAALNEFEALVDEGIANAGRGAEEVAPDPFSGIDFDFTPTEQAEIKRAPVGSVVNIPGAGAFVWDGERLIPQ